MQRPGAVVGDQVRDIDQGVDGAQADRGQLLLQPRGRWAVLHAADQPAGELATGACAVQADLDGIGELARGLGDADVFQCPQTGGGQVAGDAHDAQPVGAVRGDFEVDDGFEAERFGGRGSDGEVVRQFHDAIGFRGGLKLGGRAEHAVGNHAAHRLLDQGDAQARHIGADGGVDGGQADAGVRGAADDLLAAIPGFDLADPQPVGVGVLHRLDNLGD